MVFFSPNSSLANNSITSMASQLGQPSGPIVTCKTKCLFFSPSKLLIENHKLKFHLESWLGLQMFKVCSPTDCQLTLILYLAMTAEANTFPDVSYSKLCLRPSAFGIRRVLGERDIEPVC